MGTVERVKKEMSACVANIAKNAAAKMKCATANAKKAMAKGLGKLEKDVDATEVTKFLKRAALSSVEEEMDACTEGKSDESKLKGCVSDFAKKAITRTMGREDGDVKEEEVTKFVKQATVERVKKEMSACVANTAKNAAAKMKCATANAKKALAKGLGKLEKDVDATEVTKFLKRAALSSVEEEMDACTEGKTDAN